VPERIAIVIPSRGMNALLAVAIDHVQLALEQVADRASGTIIVCDNATDPPYARADLPAIDVLLRYDEHRSFSEACNAGVAASACDLVLLLNNDVLLHRHALDEMLDLVHEPLMGIVGTRLLFPDGTIQHCGVVFGEHGPFHDRARRPTTIVPRAPRYLQCVTGAAQLVRRDVWEQLGGLCEDYPFGYEDVDLCLRARQLGYRVACAQRVDSIHFESQTPGRVERDVPSRRVFLERWHGRWSIDAEELPYGA
jgi:GT2 family glycosyltransferase